MRKSKILLVQFRTDNRALQQEKECILKQTNLRKEQLRSLNVFGEEINYLRPQRILSSVERVILGGSGEFCFSSNENLHKDRIFWKMIKRIKPFIQYILAKDFPTLGICFGHQLLAYSLGVEVIQDKNQQEIGSFQIYLTREGKSDPLFLNLPSKFIVQLGHKDSLKSLPQKTVLLAKSNKCKIQSFRYKKHIYGVQFHPELTLDDVIAKLELYPNYGKNNKRKVIINRLKASPYASKVLRNFLLI